MWDIQAYRLEYAAAHVEALVKARRLARDAATNGVTIGVTPGDSSNNAANTRQCDGAKSNHTQFIVRRKRTVTPSSKSAGIGTYGFAGETSGAGSLDGSSGPTDTLRNFSPMQSNLPGNKLLSATELSTGVESDTLDRLQVVEREAWRAYNSERAGQNRPATLMKMLREISEIQVRQVSVARHVVRVERAVPVEWERIRDRVIGALQNHPEALAAVMEALEDEG